MNMQIVTEPSSAKNWFGSEVGEASKMIFFLRSEN